MHSKNPACLDFFIMNYYKATNPKDYSLHFYRQMGLTCDNEKGTEQIWTNPSVGNIHVLGSLDTIQCGTGNYTIPVDMLSEFDYEFSYLHFGIIYEGITYSLINKKLETLSHPSAFLAIEQSAGGINCWKCGQHFRGVEISIHMNYLCEELLPFMEYEKDSLSFIHPNIRYSYLAPDLKELLSKTDVLLRQNKMTFSLLKALCLEFLAHLLSLGTNAILEHHADSQIRYLSVGKRKIRMTSEDFEKVIKAHDEIEKDTGSFVTIHELSQRLDISEQKLKAGFSELYQQTIWNYANNLRMSHAAKLLSATDTNINTIAAAVGYQSTAAFATTFKNWSNLTPGQFRNQINVSPDLF